MRDVFNYEKKVNGSDIAKRIDERLQAKGMRRQPLADFCGFAVTNISRWSSAGSLPDVRTGLMIADFLNVNLRWLLTGEDNSTIDLPIMDFALLDKYHALPEKQQQAVSDIIDTLYKLIEPEN